MLDGSSWNAELALIVKQFLFNAGMFLVMFSFPLGLLWAKASRKLLTVSILFSNILFAFFCAARTAPFLGEPLILQSKKLMFEAQSASCKANSVVVLGGGILSGNILSEHSHRRVLIASRLVQKLSEGGHYIQFVYLSGGIMPNTNVAEAEIMRVVLKNEFQGLAFQNSLFTQKIMDSISIVSETKSKNTFENAKNTMNIVLEKNLSKKIYLVTSDWHLPRAVKTFQKQGFEVCPHSEHFNDLNSSGIFSFDAAMSTARVINEYIGVFGYYLKGWV